MQQEPDTPKTFALLFTKHMTKTKLSRNLHATTRLKISKNLYTTKTKLFQNHFSPKTFSLLFKAKSLKNVERRSRRKWLGGCAHKKYEEMARYGRSSTSPSSLS
jgi:hypothetical protein